MVKREEKKAFYKEKILSSARKIFAEEGFESATIAKIADKAGVGLGTAYNYFESKEDLFILAMAGELVGGAENETKYAPERQRETEPTGVGGPEDVERLEESPGKIISDMVLGQVRRLNVFGKKIWRVALASALKSMKSNHSVIKDLIQADYRFMGKIESRLEEMKAEGRLPMAFASDTAVNLIYGALIFNLMSYVYEDTRSFDEACLKTEESIRFVVEGSASLIPLRRQ